MLHALEIVGEAYSNITLVVEEVGVVLPISGKPVAIFPISFLASLCRTVDSGR
jgi:hypothetical protein